MAVNDYKKILIFGQGFDNYTGGGITLTSLFRGWPKHKIAVAAAGHSLRNISFDICGEYYQLGNKEQSWIFPFSKLQKQFSSGLILSSGHEKSNGAPDKTGIRKILVDWIFYPVMNWTGLIHCLSKIRLSEVLKEWLHDYNPELLYLQVSTREEILFSAELCDFLRIPTVIHMMDDWPSTISMRGLFKDYWDRKIDKELKLLLERVDSFLSISIPMSDEYRSRYGMEFKPFHNPIDVTKFSSVRNMTQKDGTKFRILYIGRIGTANRNSIYLFSKSLSHLKCDHYDITFDVFTKDLKSRTARIIGKFDNVNISPPVQHEAIPRLLSSYDLLFLPLDFSDEGLNFARYSVPTKASEYFASGTPVLVLAPADMAITKFCIENECAYCITDQSEAEICRGLNSLADDASLRHKLSENATRLADELFDVNVVSEKFQQLLITTSKRQANVQQ